MDMKKGIIVSLVGALAIASWLQTNGAPGISPDARPQGVTIRTSDGGQSARMVASGAGHTLSRLEQQTGQALPFFSADGTQGVNPAQTTDKTLSVAAKPEPEIVPAEEAARRQKMKQLGYMVPTDYYTKSLNNLKELGQKGDAYALVHLGEKYYFELNNQRSNPDFDPKLNYPELARQSFSEALANGNIRSAGIISELYLQEKNPVDAYAWHLLSKRLGDSISADWFEKTDVYASLSAEQKQQASAKLPVLINKINELSTKYQVKSIFG